jgi:hypothetical protein
MKLEQTAPLSLPSAAAARAVVAIAVPGAIGMAVVIRTLFVYLGHDGLAALIVVAMGVGLGVGLVELALRARRALGLAAETQALPTLANESVLERASPELRAVLRARLEHTSVPVLAESLTPYLVGLMVMLGLLGTLLGLFETLRGAGHVLSDSGNVEALRSGLTGPLRGLTRSFGCSAAGVSASAMLGLSAVLVRRFEAQALRAVLAYASGPWRELSPVRRQLSALEKLSSQGDSLPRAADALALAAERIDALAGRWDEAHKRGIEAQQKSLGELFARLETELGKSATAASRAMGDAIAPTLSRVVTETGATAAKQLGAMMEVVDRELQARRAADAELRGVLGEQLGALASLRNELGQLAAATARESEARAERERAREAQHSETLARELEARSERERAQQAQHADAMGALRAGAHTLEQTLASTSQTLAQSLAGTTRTLEQTLVGTSQTLAQSLAGTSHTLEETLSRTSRLLEDTLAHSGRALESALARQEEATRALLEGGAQQMARLGEVSLEGAREALAKLASVSDAQAERFTELEARLEQSQVGLAQRLSAELVGQAEQLSMLTEASRSGMQEAVAKLVGVTDQQAERFAQLEARLAQSQVALAERFAGVTEQQAGRFTELEGRLEQSQAALAEKLAGELVGQADRIGQGLAGTSQLVAEAGALLKASSVEMGAVAELFAKSVERQREAAQSWLESLGELESAVERAGRGAAADALGDQLASTQEVFARQLQFQRELFEQLRNMRVGAAPVAKHQGEASGPYGATSPAEEQDDASA